MIIFYDKKTGEIVGTIDGRVHKDQHLKMWIGDKKKVGRKVIQWKPVRWYDEDKKEVPKDKVKSRLKKETLYAEFEPDCSEELKPLMKKLDKDKKVLKKLKFDTSTGKLREKTKKELKNK